MKAHISFEFRFGFTLRLKNHGLSSRQDAFSGANSTTCGKAIGEFPYDRCFIIFVVICAAVVP